MGKNAILGMANTQEKGAEEPTGKEKERLHVDGKVPLDIWKKKREGFPQGRGEGVATIGVLNKWRREGINTRRETDITAVDREKVLHALTLAKVSFSSSMGPGGRIIREKSGMVVKEDGLRSGFGGQYCQCRIGIGKEKGLFHEKRGKLVSLLLAEGKRGIGHPTAGEDGFGSLFPRDETGGNS